MNGPPESAIALGWEPKGESRTPDSNDRPSIPATANPGNRISFAPAFWGSDATLAAFEALDLEAAESVCHRVPCDICGGSSRGCVRVKGGSICAVTAGEVQVRAPRIRGGFHRGRGIDLQHRDRVYRSLAGLCRLNEEHLRRLRGKGLTDAAIMAGGFFSWPSGFAEKTHAANHLVELYGANNVWRVPGIYQKAGSQGWMLATRGGLAVPVLDASGKIQAVQVDPDSRQERESARGKYLCASSNREGGPSPGGPIAWVPFHGDYCEEVWIVEGMLKAWVLATRVSRARVIGVMGVKSHGPLEAALKRILHDTRHQETPPRVIVAIDMNRHNPEVAYHLGLIAEKCRKTGLRVMVASWNSAHNGPDDAIQNGCWPFMQTEYTGPGSIPDVAPPVEAEYRILKYPHGEFICERRQVLIKPLFIPPKVTEAARLQADLRLEFSDRGVGGLFNCAMLDLRCDRECKGHRGSPKGERKIVEWTTDCGSWTCLRCSAWRAGSQVGYLVDQFSRVGWVGWTCIRVVPRSVDGFPGNAFSKQVSRSRAGYAWIRRAMPDRESLCYTFFATEKLGLTGWEDGWQALTGPEDITEALLEAWRVDAWEAGNLEEQELKAARSAFMSSRTGGKLTDDKADTWSFAPYDAGSKHDYFGLNKPEDQLLSEQFFFERTGVYVDLTPKSSLPDVPGLTLTQVKDIARECTQRGGAEGQDRRARERAAGF